jgi:hypothetical protein
VSERPAIIAGLVELHRRTGEGLSALAAIPELAAPEPAAPVFAQPALAEPGALPPLPDLFSIIRRTFGPITDQAFVNAVDAWYKGQPLPPAAADRKLGPDDFLRAASRLSCTVAQIRAVDEVESAGGGLEPGRAEILALDGPGGFIDGDLAKILFEAHKFHRHTGGRFTASHPNLSSPRWNRALYKGGQGEWTRLHAAMQLDRSAALKSASWGRYQILGENHKAAGHPTVEAFVQAMMSGEDAHLEAFINFVQNAGLADELRRVSDNEADCRPFAEGYNGPGYAAGDYDGKIARAHKKWRMLG